MEPANRNGSGVHANTATDRSPQAHRQNDSAPWGDQLDRASVCRGGQCNWPVWLSNLGLSGALGCVIGGLFVSPTPLGMGLMIMAMVLLICVCAINYA